MGETSIEWARYTFNPWRGCTKVSAACDHCYAETLSKRNPAVLGVWGDDGARAMAAENYWKGPLRWAAEARVLGKRERVFCASLADVGEDRPELVAPRKRLEELIDKTADALIWMLLTKRPENMARLFARETLEKCGVGTTTEDQPNADIRVPHLLRTPAGWRFISAEPLLGPMNIERWLRAEVCDHPDEFCEDIGCRGETWLDLVIAGGETDSDRPSHPDWFRSLRDQCVLAGVAFFFKQHGDWLADDLLDNLRHIGKFLTVDGRTLPKDDETFRAIEQGRFDFTGYQHFSKVGKKAAGRLLDGREWNEFPNV